MIEGLRVLPWLETARRSNPTAVELMSDCGKCMKRTTSKERQRMGCGYEKPDDRAAPWTPLGLKGAPLRHCPGYTTKLPEVVESSWARFWLDKGSLREWTDRPISEQTREAIQILECAIADEQAHALEQQRQAGAR